MKWLPWLIALASVTLSALAIHAVLEGERTVYRAMAGARKTC